MADATIRSPGPKRALIYRHSLATRLTHGVNVMCLGFLLLSGLQIFNAHPRLYWGQFGADDDHAIISIDSVEDGDDVRGVTHVGSLAIPTTGVLGASNVDGEITARAFPDWLTLPSYQDLAAGRRWHFFFAWLFVINGLIYLLIGLVSGHFKRDLMPSSDQLSVTHLAHEIADHARLRFPKGEEAKRYNALQKIAYIVVIFVLLPLMLLTGLTMSPAMDSVAPVLLDVFGGRQSARLIHFLTATSLVTFVLAHLVMVLVSGVWNNLRSIITGYYTINEDGNAK